MKAIAAFLVSVVCAATGAVEPPRVVSAIPDHGDTGVDPATKQIRIEFDQDMSPRGLSICGGGPLFPKLQGKPLWETPRVLILNVALEAAHDYQLSVNCPAFQNTRGASGEPAEFAPIWFSTAEAGKAAGPGRLTPEQNRAAAAGLRRAIDERYSYRDRVVKDWDGLFGAQQGALERAPTRAAFARAAARLLGAAEDPHVVLRVGSAPFGTFRGGAVPNVNPDLLPKVVPGWNRHNDTVATGRFDDGVGYLLITSWPGDREAVRPALEFIGALGDAPGLVVDVRPNGGGDELTAQSIAECFVGAGAVYSLNRYRDAGSPEGFGPKLSRLIEPGKGPRYGGKVVVLMGPLNLSSNESFLLMMRHGAKATLVGDRSMGSSGNPRPVELSNGVTVLLPSWQDFLPDGTLLEGRGIDPDVGISVGADGVARTDPVLEAGLRAVRAGK